jgi:hypothetical protein
LQLEATAFPKSRKQVIQRLIFFEICAIIPSRRIFLLISQLSCPGPGLRQRTSCQQRAPQELRWRWRSQDGVDLLLSSVPGHICPNRALKIHSMNWSASSQVPLIDEQRPKLALSHKKKLSVCIRRYVNVP